MEVREEQVLKEPSTSQKSDGSDGPGVTRGPEPGDVHERVLCTVTCSRRQVSLRHPT